MVQSCAKFCIHTERFQIILLIIQLQSETKWFLIFFFLNNTLAISITPLMRKLERLSVGTRKKKDKDFLIFYLKVSGDTLSMLFKSSLTLSSSEPKDSIYFRNLTKSLNKSKSDNSSNLGKFCFSWISSLFKISL